MGLGCMIGHAAHANNGHNHGNHHNESEEDFLTILKNRLAKGEINEEEYRKIRKIVLEE